MATISVVAKPDFLQSITAARPLAAVAELVWNGLDAGAKNVSVYLEPNELSGVEAIHVSDDGEGIPPAEAESLFGSLGESWKRTKRKAYGRALHGKNGKGRFKAFSLGEHVEWRSTVNFDGELRDYSIVGRDGRLSAFEVTSPTLSQRQSSGTTVSIRNLKGALPSLTDDNAALELTKTFAAYLTEYPNVSVIYDGTTLNPASVQELVANYHLGDVELNSGRRVPVAVTVIEWKVSTDRVFQLCDESGVALHDLPIGTQIRAPGRSFTIYVRSEYFRELDTSDLLSLSDLHDDVQTILRAVKAKAKEHFRLREVQERSATIERWVAEEIYPYSQDSHVSPTEAIERQVFDILAVNVESHLPSFDTADKASRKFTFRLLAQAIRDNPESVQSILQEVLGLRKEEQDDLANLLKKTSLSRLISAARTVANRIDFVEGLSDLLFNKKAKRALLERDHLHKVLESESWIFREDFHLAGSEKRLEDALQIHLGQLGQREDDPSPVMREGEQQGRVDLMLSRAIQPAAGSYEYLVVELKRPSQKITSTVLTQVESYALAVAEDHRFHSKNCKWTFLVVGNTMDDFAKRKAHQRDRPPGVTFEDSQLNITVIAKTWAEVLDDARARLSFYRSQLSYEADHESELGYLQAAHSKYIPSKIFEFITPNANTPSEAGC